MRRLLRRCIGIAIFASGVVLGAGQVAEALTGNDAGPPGSPLALRSDAP